MVIFGGEKTEFLELSADLKGILQQQKNTLMEIKRIHGIKHLENEKIIFEQIKELKKSLNKLNERIPKILDEIIIPKSVAQPVFGSSKLLIKKEEKF